MDQTYPHGTWVYQNTTSSDRRVLSNRNEVCYQQGRGEKSEQECDAGEETSQLWMEARGCILTFRDLEKVTGCRKKKELMKRKSTYCHAKSPH